jgi:DNA mismatch repair protein MLH1
LDIVSKYAVHYGGRGVGFTCKKASANVVDLSVPSSPHSTTLDAISLIYGSAVAKELQELTSQEYPQYGCSVRGWVSGANWSAKRNQFLCFINNRLVDCPALKRALLALYSTLLPRGGHPWIYLSLDLTPERIDVNVHPTKKEVHFLDEEEIVEVICNQVQDLLANANSSRNFQMTQAVLTKGAQPFTQTKQSTSNSTQATLPPSSRAGYPQHMVRVDDRLRRLDAMSGFDSQPSSTLVSHSKIRGQDEGWTVTPDVSSSSIIASSTLPAKKTTEESKTSLQSIHELREQVKKRRHLGLTNILESYTLVGVVDTRKSLALVQHGTKLFLLQYGTLMKEAAFQAILRSFGALPPMQLSPAPALSDLIESALILEQSSREDRQMITGLSDEDIIQRVCQRLLSHGEMLEEYFSIKFDPVSQTLLTLPNIVQASSSAAASSARGNIIIDLERLPSLLLRLITQVDWTEEKACLDGIMQELALAHVPTSALDSSQEQSVKEKVEKDWLTTWSQEFRRMVPSTSLVNDKVILEVASLPSLYSVFERC